MSTDVDRSAPVLAHHEITVDAPLETIWRLHSDVNSWPSWHTDITHAHLDGAFEIGASFEWTSFDFTVTSTIYELSAPSRVLWGGTASGITGIHGWVFSEAGGGVTVATTESFAGQPVEADRANMQSLLDASLASWLSRLKQAAESRS